MPDHQTPIPDAPPAGQPTVWHNPSCSKSRGATSLLADHDVAATVVRYLDDPPSIKEIRRVLALLGETDPRAMMRTREPLYRDLHLDTADPEALVEAMARHPILIERPIVIWPDRAVIARPPERLLDLLGQ